ncbi:MAG: phosphatidylserine decarboxylase [Defluviitaleaceae bacterium]|nr:phosphatidylserine decarboxylase [Defluviitaleaceae bacterium]
MNLRRNKGFRKNDKWVRLRPPRLRRFRFRRNKRTTGQPLWVYNNGQLEQERIVAERWMRLIYENPVGRVSMLWWVKRKAVSRLYGLYCRTRFSARKIPQFIEENQIDMTGCNGPYKNFAQFFSREKEDVNFPEEPQVLGSPCEGMVSINMDITPESIIAAKGADFSLAELFGDTALAEDYRGGTMVRIRLTPSNYHRMHFFDDGVVTGTKFLRGDLYSVNPLAVDRVKRLYCRNKRALINFQSKHFGDVALVEVGATFVGSIVHCFDIGQQVTRGQQASFFLPGGSLVLLFFKNGAFVPDEALISQTNEGYETRAQIGHPLGS